MQALASVIGEEGLGETDRKVLEFSRQFEGRFVKQGIEENRSFEQSLELAWTLFKSLPRTALERLPDVEVKSHLEKVE